MDDSGQSEFSAFKKAEKMYKLHKTQVLKYSKGKLRGHEWIVRSTDLSNVVDVRSGREWSGVQNAAVAAQQEEESRQKVYCFKDHPGFFLLPDALTLEEQKLLAQAALTEFPNPPAATNLGGEFGDLPNLYAAAAQGLYLARVDSTLISKTSCSENPEHGFLEKGAEMLGHMHEHDSIESPECDSSGHPQSVVGVVGKEMLSEAPRAHDGQSSKSVVGTQWCTTRQGTPASRILERLRWTALGPKYDWSQRCYSTSTEFKELPASLVQFGMDCAALVGIPFEPDAALVNYYGKGHTIGGHIDDAEFDLEQPIVSLSLGCPAIFLMGGETKDVAPTPILLGSGDVVVLGGPARKCYHGVPRVLTPDDNIEEKAASKKTDTGFEVFGVEHGVETYLKDRRINISIRRVLKQTGQA